MPETTHDHQRPRGAPQADNLPAQALGALGAGYRLPTPADPTAPVVSLCGVAKSFSGVRALRSVDLEVRHGTVHALCGENGAGKSTVSRILAGIVQPDSGELRVHGAATRFPGPAAARRAGISFVPQELSTVPELSIAENLFLGRMPRTPIGLVDRAQLRRQAVAVLEALRLPLDPFTPLRACGPAVQEWLMIARGLSWDASLFILDEPTASLTNREVDLLFEFIEQARQRGAAFIYISHRLQELERIADDVTVLRDGQLVVSCPMASVTEDQLVQAMVGRPVERFFSADQGTARAPLETTAVEPPEAARPALTVKGLTRAGTFDDITFSVDAGTITGIAGLVGAGRTEVLRAIFGIDRVDTGQVSVRGEAVRIRSPRQAIRHGINLVPEERKSQGLVLGKSVAENLVGPHLAKFARAGWVRDGPARAAAQMARDRLGIAAASLNVPVHTLSGGNQQKVVIGRCMLGGGTVYLLDEPTRGVDVGAKAEIYALIGDLARSGCAVVVVSSELPELLGICERILVMRNGRLVADLPSAAATEETILAAAMGRGGVIAGQPDQQDL